MPSRALGFTCWTAWARTCAVECRRTSRPSGLSMVTGSTTSPSASTWARSTSWPPTRATTTLRSSAKRSAAVVPSATDRSSPATVTVIWADTAVLTLVGDGGGCAARFAAVGKAIEATSDVATQFPARPASRFQTPVVAGFGRVRTRETHNNCGLEALSRGHRRDEVLAAALGGDEDRQPGVVRHGQLSWCWAASPASGTTPSTTPPREPERRARRAPARTRTSRARSPGRTRTPEPTARAGGSG